jgi:hypothetical protein
MKKSVYKSAALLVLALFTVSFAANAEELTKEYHKEYKPGPNTVLGISNRYGDIVIQSWNQNDVVIDVKVKVEYPSRDRAEKLLDMITVEFSESSGEITAKTEFSDEFKFSGWSSPSRSFSINYSIKMPVAMALALSNKYGDTDINELSGLVNLDIKYGNLAAGKLSRGNEKPLSKINIGYGKASIQEAGWLDLYLRYSGLAEITKSQALLLDSRYSTVTLGTTSSIVGDSKYDKIKIDNINNLDVELGYTSVRIGELSKKLNYSGSYGSFTVDRIPANFESVTIDSRYAGVKLGIDGAANYRLEARVSYGGIDYDESRFSNERRIIENTSKEVAGVMGSAQSPSSKVSITASYGSVSLN